MRKREKDRLLEIMDTLADGIREARQMLEGFQKEAAILLLSDCQETVIAVGNAIEEAEGEGSGGEKEGARRRAPQGPDRAFADQHRQPGVKERVV